MAKRKASLTVLAGVNGAGKSSIAGAVIVSDGGVYFNPDQVARRLRETDARLSAAQANSLAWKEGVEQLRRAIDSRTDFTFETTLGGDTIVELLERAIKRGIEVRVWYAGLQSVQLHLARVAARVKKGGHDIPEADIRRRYVNSRLNLIRLLPRLTELVVYDNSDERDPLAGSVPEPVLVLHVRKAKIVGPADLRKTPEWAKVIVAAALKSSR